jgi:hypothetical protein
MPAALPQMGNEDVADKTAAPSLRVPWGIFRLLTWRNVVARGLDGVTLGCLIWVHRVLVAPLTHAKLEFDERYFLWEGFCVTRGQVPYRDFQEFKPPMVFLVNALGLKLFGLDGMRYRQILALLTLSAFLAVAVALLSRQLNRFFVAALVAMMMRHDYCSSLHDSGLDDAEGIALAFFMLAFGILLVRTRWERTQQVVGGVVLALVPLSKEPLVFGTMALWLSLLALHSSERMRHGTWRGFALYTLAGAFGVGLIWLSYMIATRSLYWYIVQLKLTLAYTARYAEQMGIRTEPGWRGWCTSLHGYYVNFSMIGEFLPLMLAGVLAWRRRTAVGVFTLATIVATFYAATIGHLYWKHYFIMAMGGTFFGSVMGAIALQAPGKPSNELVGRWLGGWWLATATLLLWPQLADLAKASSTLSTPTSPVDPEELAFVLAHTSRTERVWTSGDPSLYVYADRLSSIREAAPLNEILDFYPGNTDEERVRGMRAEFERNPPKVVVLANDKDRARKSRILRALAEPFLRDHHYTRVSDKFYVAP